MIKDLAFISYDNAWYRATPEQAFGEALALQSEIHKDPYPEIDRQSLEEIRSFFHAEL